MISPTATRNINIKQAGKVEYQYYKRFQSSTHLKMSQSESTIAKLKAMAAQLRAEAAQLEVIHIDTFSDYVVFVKLTLFSHWLILG